MTDIFEYIGYKDNIRPYDKRITKSQLSLNGELIKAERDLLTEGVEEIRLAYVMNTHTYPMEVIINEDERYEYILFVTVALKKECSIHRLSRIIQHALPSPVVIIFCLEGKYQFASAWKRLNKAEKGKLIVEEVHYGNRIDLNSLTETHKAFLEAISYGNIPALDYKQAYLHIHRQIYKEGNAEIAISVVAESFEEFKQKTEALKIDKQEIERLTKLLNQKTVSLKEKVELAKRIRKLKMFFYD